MGCSATIYFSKQCALEPRPDYERTGNLDDPHALQQVNFTALAEACNIWRIYNDIQDSWWHVLDIQEFWAQQQHRLAPAAGPGAFNDPDMALAWGKARRRPGGGGGGYVMRAWAHA